ncbi:DUF3800 domain-containing protein [Parabacteroides sp. PF5-6]|uniref:DUF3800 domain-containing protein n=1 Tax=Parabacteroides sp. PF5-6 TaxID=1742403 RepID=UPI0024057516|nr:DUF3800 domain-containing protein [Parabacteroides sp. PF5-6]MDF9830549.1 hypothetical protein [Parabacteroides sp. PF5-6]
MKYYLFLDECGDQSLANIDVNFPIFTLCGILVSETEYKTGMGPLLLAIKRKFWKDKKIIFHSRDIRKCEKGFEIFFDMGVKASFYHDLNKVLAGANYTVIACSILKEKYIKSYGKLSDVYGVSLSYIIERIVFLLDTFKREDSNITLHIFAEKRGKREDRNLLNYYNEVLDRGTYYVSKERIRAYYKSFKFIPKSDDILGTQVADLIAYPITRHVLDPKAANPAYDVIKDKIYKDKGRLHGLKVFP